MLTLLPMQNFMTVKDNKIRPKNDENHLDSGKYSAIGI